MLLFLILFFVRNFISYHSYVHGNRVKKKSPMVGLFSSISF